MRDIISPFADREAVEFIFAQHPALKSLAQEFCAAFKDVTVAQSKSGGASVAVLMGNGITVASLGVDRYNGDLFYRYTSEHFVRKLKKSMRANKDTRDASTITGLIKAIIKNKEHPFIEPVYNSFTRAIVYAFNASSKSRDVYVEMSHELRAYLVKRFVDGDKHPRDPQQDGQLEKLYDGIVEREREQISGRENIIRFSKGCKLIGIAEIDYSKSEYAYFIGNVTAHLNGKFGVDKVVIEGLQRQPDIFACQNLAADAAIIKAYMETKPGASKNAFGVPFSDEYYPDIDIATGYENRHMLWLLIPNEPNGS